MGNIESKIESKTDRQERIPHFKQPVIRKAKIAVIGAGATGNEVLKCLALTGFHYVFIADMDHISTSNLSRTVLFDEDDVGAPKAETAAKRYCKMCIEKDAHADSFGGDLCYGLGEGVLRHVDLVIGCVDNVQTRIFVSNVCQLLNKPYIDTGIGGFNWNLAISSGQSDCPCYACTLTPKEEMQALARVRNSCDVTRRVAASEGLVPTIGISAAAVAALAVQEAIKICHHLGDPESGLMAPQYGKQFLFIPETNELKIVRRTIRAGCEHHDAYVNYGGVHETPMSCLWKLKDVLAWVETEYGKPYSLATYKDNVCAERNFITKALCKSCGQEINVYLPQPLRDYDIMCDACRATKKVPYLPSNATRKNLFERNDEALQEYTLLDLGIPFFHIVEFAPSDGEGDSLYLELTGDMEYIMPNLPKE